MRPSRMARKLRARTIASRPYHRNRFSCAWRASSRAWTVSRSAAAALRPAVGRTWSVILFSVLLHDPKGDDVERQGDAEQRQAQAESRQRLGTVELLVAGQ